MIDESHIEQFLEWQADWNKFARDVFEVDLDPEQAKILESIQKNKMTSVCSGTSRGKDFVTAIACLCFLYLTPSFNESGELIGNTKVAMTAPTDRQIENIMFPEISRLFKKAKVLPGRLVSYDIRTDNEEWFLTGFKASKDNLEAWTGFHAVNTMFAITEASGLDDKVFEAIEGNLQGNSRLVIIFNPNSSTGYAANSQKSKRFKKFRLDSLNSPNVKTRKIIIPGQVDYEWVKDKVDSWCQVIGKEDIDLNEGDFEFEGKCYRPNDLFRVKVRGMFPKISEDTLIPIHWIEKANENWLKWNKENGQVISFDKFGADVAGMGRDNSTICPRKGNYVGKLESYPGNGNAEHMRFAGVIVNKLDNNKNSKAFIDTIGEGAGVFSRLQELGYKSAISCKYSENADRLKDVTEVYEFANMRAYLFWAVRDWLNPAINPYACLPPDDELLEEATEIKWKFQSNGKIIIEPKDDIKKRLKRSPDKFDAFANTFYPRSEKLKVYKPNITGKNLNLP